MYSWGGSTADWKKPGAYKYDSARSPYLDKLASASKAKGGRSYVRNDEPDIGLVDPFGKKISSDSENAIVVAVDVTGSMSSWPGEIFDRLPLFYQTLSQYRPDLEVCFAAIGDATCDQYPLQVNHFGKGVSLEDNLKALGCEGGGGGQISESYELFGYFIHTHCELKNAQSPFLLIYGDEKYYLHVDKSQVKHFIGDSLEGKVESAAIWKGLLQKFNTFYLHKPYGSGGEPAVTSEVGDYWAKVLGRQRVIELPSCDRAVDVAMAIVARYWGQYGDFRKSIKARHDDSEISPVEHSIRFLPVDPAGPITRNSRLLASRSTKASRRLDE
ncbi:MAG: hypothetical protein ABIF10_07845 [Candidatus Woesearchaeota archaeon]